LLFLKPPFLKQPNPFQFWFCQQDEKYSVTQINFGGALLLHQSIYTPLSVVSHARKTLHVSTTATIAQIPVVSSKEGTVIGAVLSTRKFHQTHMNIAE
jgi:hypothetical protein